MAKLSWFLVPVTFYCWWRAYRLHLRATDSISRKVLNNDNGSVSFMPEPLRRTQDDLIMGDSVDQLFYFVQLSDIHASIHNKKGGLKFLERFLNYSLPVINPEFVLVTGDITDAKDAWKVGSQQILQEWSNYNSLLEEYQILDRVGVSSDKFWYDQRGNHDCFNVPSFISEQNLFQKYSSVKEEQYWFQVQKPYGNYTFIALDSCPISGPSRPFNFFGYLDRYDMDYFYSKISQYSVYSNHTFLMAHYPYKMILTGYASSGASFNQLSRYVSVFLSGHLHKLVGGLGEMMHTHHMEEQFLELELSDMKSHGSYRILSIDHDLISFVDASILKKGSKTSFDDAPGVLITNPKDSRYLLESHEPVHRVLKSTHIRFLVFSKRPIVNGKVYIDGVLFSEDIKKAAGFTELKPLYVVAWNPALYTKKKHTLRIEVTDSNGDSGYQELYFRTDGMKDGVLGGPGAYIISTNYEYWFKFFFMVPYLIITLGLLLLPKLFSAYLHRSRRYHRWRVRYSAFLVDLDRPVAIRLSPEDTSQNRAKRYIQIMNLRLKLVYLDFQYFVHATIYRLVTLTSLPGTFYPLYCYALYMVVGPFFIGELIPDSSMLKLNLPWYEKFGYFYLVGIYVEHNWLPLLDTWLFGLFELVYLLAPLVIYLSFCITPPEQLYGPKVQAISDPDIYYFPPIHNRRKYPLHRRLFVRLIVMMIVLYQFINVFFLYLYYGPVAMIFSPGKTWMVIWSTYALYRHRWSFHGREIDLLHDDEDEDDDGDWLKALWRSTSRKILRRRSVVVKSDSADMKMNNESTARLYTKERKQAQHSKKA